MCVVAGTGVTYINNAGSIAQTLYHSSLSGKLYDPTSAAQWQAEQVSIISMLNFAGRILIGPCLLPPLLSFPSTEAKHLFRPLGLLTDALKTHFHLPRSHSLLLVSLLFLLSQVLALFVDDVRNLWIVSAALGLALGSVSLLMPMVVLDWWGMHHFSENWGYIVFSPAIAGNIFSYAFGRILDSNTVTGEGGK
ncbi:hypothetical protein H0H87_005786, partial [Tephrocybe sp. NHM501043]